MNNVTALIIDEVISFDCFSFLYAERDQNFDHKYINMNITIFLVEECTQRFHKIKIEIETRNELVYLIPNREYITDSYIMVTNELCSCSI